ncbi:MULTISPECIES: hypothetical protein [Streptomyces]|uniref:hypothetical protein n=1 Tax=Streptomyces TaxID=1883 RepID=UPI001676B582|nr:MULTISPECIES: hypothetical protein [Streptomyces]MBD3580717.1 hypothetical protein [Streptomyces sp. KD18]
MVRRKREKRKRPPFGMPTGIILPATAEGWRHSVCTAEGGMLCGALPDVPIHAGPADARDAAAAMVAGLARDFHRAHVEVAWDPPREPWSWTGRVSLVSPPPDACGETAG